MSTSYPLTYKQFGEKTILIEWPASIQEAILYDIIRYKATILDHMPEAIEEGIVGYHSLAIKYSAVLADYERSKQMLERLYDATDQSPRPAAYLWELPVCYDRQFGIDLEEMSGTLGLTVEELIARHSEAVYTVYFIGFLPGFLYLGGLDERLHLPRKATPRLLVPKGAVAIGGQQTGIYPMQSAGGWHIMGNTPVPLFDLKKEPPCFAKAGDKIKFSPVSMVEYRQVETAVHRGTYEFSKTLLHA